MENIDQTLKELVVKNSLRNINKDSIKDELKFVEDLGYDSLRYINLIVEIEDTFGVQLTLLSELVVSSNTYGDLKNFVVKQLDNK